MQNSVSLSFPSPSRSPCSTMASASSLLIPSIPNRAEFLIRLSPLIKPVSGSARSLKPPHNSDTKVSTPSFSAITGNMSSNTSSTILSFSLADWLLSIIFGGEWKRGWRKKITLEDSFFTVMLMFSPSSFKT
ncbi:hypothetical protein V8G54_032279 [Vigna mungo]|uniref:Uncharacterized protein n=1 Tax=Vigna mungo TaxID=3915 RepID=A0AAQ3RGJ2_VIGMU